MVSISISTKLIYWRKSNFREMNRNKASVTTQGVFLYRVLRGIASYSEYNLAIRSRLHGVEYFCYSEWLYGVDYFYY